MTTTPAANPIAGQSACTPRGRSTPADDLKRDVDRDWVTLLGGDLETQREIGFLAAAGT